jgi:hypothetical protein
LPTRIHLAKPLCQDGRRVGWISDAALPLCNRRHGSLLVIHFMEQTDALIDCWTGDLASNAANLGALTVGG